MTLLIRALSLRNEPLSQAIVGRFDERGGTIGRSDSNTLTLPDPERHVSRLQAEVICRAGAYAVRNVGSAAVIVVNGQPVRPGEELSLADGDELDIGGYHLRAEVPRAGSRSARGRAAPAVAPRAVVAASSGEARTDPPGAPRGVGGAHLGLPPVPPPSGDPFAGLLGMPAAATPGLADPFAGLLGDVPPAAPAPDRQAPAPAVRARGGGGVHAPGAADASGQAGGGGFAGPPAAAGPGTPAPAVIPDDFDPFAESAPSPDLGGLPSPAALTPDAAASPGAPGRGEPPVLDDWIRSQLRPAAVSPGIDEMFGLPGGAGPAPAGDALAAFLATPVAAPAPPGAGVPDDPLAQVLGGPAAPVPPAAPLIDDHHPDLGSAWSPPDVVDPRRARKPAARPVAPPAAEDALWQAFCRGAGLPALPLPQGLRPELMQVLGELLQHAVTGAIKLAAVRTAARQELRVPVTTIQAQHNNPLKFAADPGAALEQLVQPPIRGFMPGPEAMRDLMDDLISHQVASMAGTRAALKGMLQRFEPARLESRLAPPGVLDALVPMNRRAKLWELYLEHHTEVADAAQEDFHELFGRAFVQAYEEQLDRMSASRARRRR